MYNEFDGECPICGNGNLWVGLGHDTSDVCSLNCTKCGFTAGQLNNGWITLKLKFTVHIIRTMVEDMTVQNLYSLKDKIKLYLGEKLAVD